MSTPSVRNDSFSDRADYDLEGAAAICHRLRATKREPAEAEPAPEPPRFVRFSLDRLRFGAERAKPSSTAPQADLGSEIPWSGEMMGSEGWSKMLQWCGEALDADGAFVVDGRGLLVGHHGVLVADTMQEMGARLLMAFEQADQMAPDGALSRSISIQLSRTWLAGMRVAVSDDEMLTIGVVTSRPLSAEARTQIVEAFAKKARGV